ncbi:hypothetical protein CHS0354_007126 [Potamilus streckersoni]|uniref:Uncharacterized protein n=1 Tax=Potamilus streckersoni TaxID=2493646 RepID=A0AAE0T242_9BIVA|nr:hypothetical protein CHS0354_007126 [Potamilus streckersoni]
MIMIVNGFLSFLFYMFEVVFIRLANPKQAPNTYVLRNGVANISFEIDKKEVDGYYVDVLNPMKKKIFQCLGSNPENVSEAFKTKIQLSGDYESGTISFSVLNVTEEDAGIYRSVIEMKNEEVGRQVLIVFAQFQKPKISTTKTANDREEFSQALMCQVETNGTPPEHPIPVFYKWKRNGYPVEHSDKYGIQNSTLIIKYLQRSDLTDYFTCLAQNDYGAKSPDSTALTISQYSMPLGSCGMSCVNGICSNVMGEIKCNCMQGWTGLNCSTEKNECSSNPCHRGTCYNVRYGEYLCVCKPGWTGKQCELDIDECAGSPCVNGGNCIDLANDYICHCTQGWTGKTCEIAINECQSSPCRQGTCEDLPSSYRCMCDDKWTGTNCDTAISVCSTEPCVNGKCYLKLNDSDSYYCVCKEGWSGTNCNNDVSSHPYPGVVGAGCAIIAIILLIFAICYRRNKTRLYMDTKMNSEEVYHDVKRIQSGDYWTIDDEQIYDIRRRIKSEVLVEASNTNPSDDYPYLQSEGCMETFNEGIKTAAEGYLNPAFSVHLNAKLEIKNTSRNNQNS